jgi:formate dehydrogenase major subunit
MITLTLDGKKVHTQEGSTLLKVANENGIEIPTLCYNSKISKTTSCLVCSVKNLKTGRNIPSCATIATEGMEIDASSDEIKSVRRTLLNLLLSEHTGDCEAPCKISCPAHASVEEYVREGKNGNFLESLKLIKKRIPLPISIGRVCPRFCEKDCRRNLIDSPVAINDFKRLAADLHYETYIEELPELTKEKVAIVGAGPAGLATAYYLRLKGIKSTIYDKMPTPGGMLRYGIPEYRLPKKLLDKEIAHFQKLGIDFKYNIEIGKDIPIQQLQDEYNAVAVTIGCWRASSMRTEGEELSEEGITWLNKIAKQEWSGSSPGKVLVIGGGNTAMDCVRTSIRLGSPEVICLYRRTEIEMPAEQIEILEAKEEGVKFQFLTAPLKLKKKGDKLLLTCQKMKLGEPDASGRRRPVPIENSEFEVTADTVIAAIGQKTDAFAGIKVDKWGNIDADTNTLNVQENIFACGDCVSGAATVVEAVAGGYKTAESIYDFLNNKEHKEPNLINVSRGHWNSLSKDDLVYIKEPSPRKRTPQNLIDIEKRKSTFQEVASTFTEKEIKQEGERCIECGCSANQECKLKKFSEQYSASPSAIKGEKKNFKYDTRHPSIIQDEMKCIKCGICVKICSEVIGEGLLARKERGFNTVIGTVYQHTLPDSCSECGVCIKECPVGALDWKKQ